VNIIYINAVPIDATVRYSPAKIVAGENPIVHCTVKSRAAVPIRIDSVSLALSHSKIFRIGSDINLDANRMQRLKVERTLPPAVTDESVDAVL
jgi:hypothetical protein